MNLFVLNDEIYDNYLHEFISKNNLFIKEKTFLENILVQPTLYVDDFYYNTLFEILETHDKELFESLFITFIPTPVPKDQFNIFSVQYKEYKLNNWVEGVEGELSDLYNSFSINNSNNEWFIEIFREYFDTEKDLECKITTILGLLSNRVKNNMDMYIFVPCYLFILTKLKNNIINK